MSKLLLLFDIKLMRPGCVLLAAAHGATSSIANRFKTEHWLLTPTPDLKVYAVTEDELDILVARVNARPDPHKRQRRVLKEISR